MASKTLNTRLQLKYDSLTNWQSCTLKLLAGEVAIVEIPTATKTVKNEKGQDVNVTTPPTVLFKVGDGNKTFAELPWASALAADVHSWAKGSEADLYTLLTSTGITIGEGENAKTYKFLDSDEVEAKIAEATRVLDTVLADVDTTKSLTETFAPIGTFPADDTTPVTSRTLAGAFEAAKAAADDADEALTKVKELLEGDGTANSKGLEETLKEYTDKEIKKVLFQDGNEGTIAEAYDTIKEIADWITSEGETATDLIDNIQSGRYDTTYTFEDGNNGTFTVTPSTTGAQAITVDTGAKKYVDDVIGEASVGDTKEATGIHKVIEDAVKTVADELDTLQTELSDQGSTVWVFDCGNASTKLNAIA